ncbi:CoA-binding protein [Candidatus Koribacter versatilis Ellin345]|uniref:CoA-binding protein n=1 Tax=Koribacter versatilis (strain Ellin345) TaxID=204669 RepID=Q1IM93_KORVE|nr:bifunctional acetate--CoA ligase family protein/GNAT family N-acetyltransferase [Candidatus Koribacter versatilis]ABF42007.1 CoA-binding protein [Candidatus Koribacter versatilis Ellin345]
MSAGSKAGTKADPAHDVLRAVGHPLDSIFSPQSVAVIGATERVGSVGRSVLWNILSSPFGGTLYPVNPKRNNILGVRAYKSIADLPERPELVVVTTPADSVPGIIQEAVDNGVTAGIVISAGFKEFGEHGKQLEHEISRIIRGKMRIIGPNCLGVMNPIKGLNATFANTIARPGNVAFISQSGALCTAVLDWSLKENVGFSSFVSIGSMLDVDWGDLISYLGNDPRTHAIVIYMESIGNARSFLSAAREVSLTKPIIVIKAGRTAAAAKAAASHTGSLTGSDEVLDAAFRRVGVLRVNTIADVFYMTDVLAKQPRPQGNRLCIVTNAGGPGVLATDALIQGGGALAELSEETMKAFDELLPPHWSHNNPVDILGDAEPERYAKSLQIAAKDPSIDGMLVVMTPQGMTNPTQIAEQLKPYGQSLGKPVLASWMGGVEVAAGEKILDQAKIPTFAYPDSACRAFNYMWQYSYNLKGIYETPTAPGSEKEGDRARAEKLINDIRQTGRTILTEYESKKLLEMYGIPTVPTEVAATEEEAVAHADKMGYPIVLKLYSLTITHKTDVGGVVLNLRDAAAVRKAFNDIRTAVTEKKGAEHFQGVTVQPMAKLDGYELIIGSSLDPQFGPVLLFGTGGQLVEVFKDRALAIPPLNSTLARRMMDQTKIYTALKGVRGRKSVDMAALENLMVRFSELIAEQPWIKELDINPLLASPDRLLALDARVVVHGPEVKAEDLPKTAIRAYPTKYVAKWKMKNGEEVMIRPIRPEDEPTMIQFHQALSERTVYLRYFQPLKLSQRTAHERLTRICFADYDREMPLVVVRKPENGDAEILAVGRLSKLHGRNEAELAALVRDGAQHLGLGSELYRRMLQVARDEKIAVVSSNMLAENHEMRAICKKLGFELKSEVEDNTIHAELAL